MNYAVINSTDGSFHVHRAGCADIERDERRANGPHWITAADSVDGLIREECADLNADFGYDAFGPVDFHVLPCAHRA